MTAADPPARSPSGQDVTCPLVVPLDGRTAAGRDLLGGKASGLVRMAALGIPVPPAFTITTAACRRYRAHGRQISELLWSQVLDALGWLEDSTGQQFGGSPPLLVSVRSGASVSMPGMMDTLLNVGLTRPMLSQSGPGRPAEAGWLRELATSIRRSFADAPFAVLTADQGGGARAEALAQLRWAIGRIFDSWHNERAEIYRQANGIPSDLGTAVTVQAMVFGNRDDDSGTGVYITRNPATGANEPFGEWLPRAQGESLVSGERSPLELAALHASMPEVHCGLVADGRRLEAAERYPVEIEFTVESGRLYFLQARRSTCTPRAAVCWAVGLVDEGLLEIADVIDWVDEESLRALTEAGGTAGITGRVLARGTGVVPGQCSALVVDDADEADRLAEEGSRVILARPRTSPHDIHGFLAAAGVITERGGSTSHAAVVARQIGLPCVVGCGEGAVAAVIGRVVTIDGTRGVVYDGVPPAAAADVPAAQLPELSRLLRWREGDRSSSIRSSEAMSTTSTAVTASTAVLRCLRVKGRAATADIAEGSGVDERTAQEILELAAENGLAGHRAGRRGGWMLTLQGREEVARLLEADRAGLDTARVATLYEAEFLALNREFKQLCTRWQLGGANGAVTEDVRSELTAIHQRNRDLCARLATTVPWLGRYQGRFDSAYRRVQDGDAAALLRPLSGSYHDVWIELHEDLYLVLDRVREDDD